MGFMRVLFRQDNIEISSLVLGVGGFMYYFGKNSYLMKKWIQYTGKKNENDELIPVETVLKFRFESVLQKFEFTEWNKKYISLYINKELDPNSLGSCTLKQGISIGVPEYYQRRSDEDIKKSVVIKNNTIDWDSPAGKRFLESLKLNEFAQKYIIACNVDLVRGHYATFDSLIFPVSLLGAYSCVYFRAAEDRVTTFGAQFIEGGIEYYEKKLERNKALRELLPNDAKHFTEDGNEIGIFRVKGLLDTTKLVAAKERLVQFTYAQEQKVIPTPNPNPHPIF